MRAAIRIFLLMYRAFRVSCAPWRVQYQYPPAPPPPRGRQTGSARAPLVPPRGALAAAWNLHFAALDRDLYTDDMSHNQGPRGPGHSAVCGITLALLVVVVGADPAAAQVRPDPPPVSAIGDTVTVVPAPRYAASGLRRALLGRGWRELWTTPVDVQVFDFDAFAGGVDWVQRGGGNQSITLHLDERDGWREYRFRSVNKFPTQALPSAVNGAHLGRAIEDMVSAMFPAAPLMVPPFLAALDILHVEPVLRIMPDDPRLEVYQDTFAGMLGTVEIKPNEAPGNTPGWAGYSNIKGTEAFLEDLEDSKADRLDEREFLAARLVDFLINDADRTQDNMRWARSGEKDDYHWRPVPIDRDFAFFNGTGWLTALGRLLYPKLVAFGPEYPKLKGLTYSSHLLDRRLLQRLDRDDFTEVGLAVQRAITDDVIEAAIAELPERWQRETGAPARLRETLRARRDGLADFALRFYDNLATDVDIRGTDEPDLAVIERHRDGRVRVTITWPEGTDRAGDLFYDRMFLPSETSEVRIYLHGGDDEARVIGAASGAIAVRLIGGGGDDLLVDAAGGGATHFYDARGDNRFETGAGTRVSTRVWTPPVPTEGLRMRGAWVPDWGGGLGLTAGLDYRDGAGVIIGVGPTWKSYGFRRMPYHWNVATRLLYATDASSFGAELNGDYRLENSPRALTLDVRATTFDAFRFHGYGNDSPELGDAGLVDQNRVAVEPALAWHIGWRNRETAGTLVGPDADRPGTVIRPLEGRLDVGPVFVWSDASPDPASPLATTDAVGAGSLSRLGLRTALQLDRTDRDAAPRRGWRLDASASAYPAALGLSDGFAEGGAHVAGFVPLIGDGPHLVLRAGGSAVTGVVPVQHTPFVGGRTTLRGYRWERFRGDAATHATAELRVPLLPVDLVLRWDLGVFGLADAGRVWVDGDSPGGWHTGVGGGVWLEALGTALSAAYARGEEDRLYFQLGMTF